LIACASRGLGALARSTNALSLPFLLRLLACLVSLFRCHHRRELGVKRTRRIFDASELFFQTSSDCMTSRKTWSEYKHHHTAKFLASIEPSGGFDFVSKAYGGRIDDVELAKICGLLDLVEEGDVSLADRGFILKHLFDEKSGELLHPPKSWNGQEYFTEEESKYTSDIARLRIHIERAFARVKQFQIFAKTLKITQSDLVGKMFKVACYLTHYMPPLVSDKEDESEP
jgi:hypothetical protein